MHSVPIFKRDWLQRQLAKFEQRRARRLAIAIAVVLLTPTLFSGLALDDYKLVDQMSQPGTDRWPGSAPFDLFRWMDPQHNRQFMDGLGFPWWTLESAKVGFMRPVSSLSHMVDHWLWPTDPFWMHAQSLLWFALLLLLAAETYSELIEDSWVAGVASVLFAFDDAHGVPAGWLCNRNALLAGVFGIGALLLHHRSRRSGRRVLAGAAALCFALSLLSGELGVGMLGYLAAYALLFETGPIGPRARSIMPYGGVFLGWAVLRSKLGYGSYGIDFYLDPIREPAAFLGALPSRWAQLVSSQASGMPSDIWGLIPPDLRSELIAFALLGAGVMAWFLWPSLRASRVCRFWALGAALSAVPVTAALPSDRLLVLVGIGVMAVLARAIHDGLALGGGVNDRAIHERGAAGVRAALASAVVVFHLGLEPLMLPLSALGPATLDHAALDVDASLPKDAAVHGETVIVVDVPDPLVLSSLPLRRQFLHETPSEVYWLAAAQATLRLERRAPNVLRVSAKRGLFSAELESGARTTRQPFKVGDRVALAEMKIDVIELTADGLPSVCDFIFDQPLESATYLWKRWRAKQLVNFRVPAIGETVDTSPDEPRS